MYEAWRRGRLRWLLLPHQRESYDAYRQWEQLDPTTQPGQFARIYVDDIGRRWGKTTKRFVIRTEDCLRTPGRVFRYVTAYQKDIEEIVDDAARRMLDTCPAEFRPEYKQSHGAQGPGFYFKNGSVLKLAGLDKNPNALRGRASDGDDISEAAFLRNLVSNVKNVLYAQYQGRPWARMCLESSAPDEVDGEYDTVFVADAKLREQANRSTLGTSHLGYYYATIDDNTSLSDAERDEFIRAAGGREHPDCQREYFNVRVRNPTRVLIPEFDFARHVRRVETPAWLDGYTGMDPGMSDKLALVVGYWHAEIGKFVVCSSWAEYNAGTREVADAVRGIEADVFGAREWWDGKATKPQPFARVSDVDLRIIHDLWTDHGLHFDAADKSPGSLRADDQAGLLSLRNAFRDDLIIVDPEAGPVLEHIIHGKWNERRTDWERHELHGHYDCVAALKYLWRRVERNRNAKPPEWFLNSSTVSLPHHADTHRGGSAQLPNSTISNLQRAFGEKPAWRR